MSEKMDQHLKQFYGLDASYRKLAQSDQERLFTEWADQNGINERLCFESPRWIPIARWTVTVFGIIYLCSFIPGAPELARAAFPFAVALMFITFTFDGQRPTTKLAEQDAAEQSATDPEEETKDRKKPKPKPKPKERPR